MPVRRARERGVVLQRKPEKRQCATITHAHIYNWYVQIDVDSNVMMSRLMLTARWWCQDWCWWQGGVVKIDVASKVVTSRLSLMARGNVNTGVDGKVVLSKLMLTARLWCYCPHQSACAMVLDSSFFKWYLSQKAQAMLPPSCHFKPLSLINTFSHSTTDLFGTHLPTGHSKLIISIML